MNDLLNDQSTYEKIESNPLTQLQKKCFQKSRQLEKEMLFKRKYKKKRLNHFEYLIS